MLFGSPGSLLVDRRCHFHLQSILEIPGSVICFYVGSSTSMPPSTSPLRSLGLDHKETYTLNPYGLQMSMLPRRRSRYYRYLSGKSILQGKNVALQLNCQHSHSSLLRFLTVHLANHHMDAYYLLTMDNRSLSCIPQSIGCQTRLPGHRIDQPGIVDSTDLYHGLEIDFRHQIYPLDKHDMLVHQ